jgi:hypothetical protein
MAALDRLLQQALLLSQDQRGTLAATLLRTLDTDDEESLTSAQWQAEWTLEVNRRVREAQDGTADLVDGDQVLAETRAWLDTQRR